MNLREATFDSDGEHRRPPGTLCGVKILTYDPRFWGTVSGLGRVQHWALMPDLFDM